MKLKRVDWNWLEKHRVSTEHLREPINWLMTWAYVDGRFYKRAERRSKRFKKRPIDIAARLLIRHYGGAV